MLSSVDPVLIVTPTDQLTRRLLYRCFSVCFFFAWVIADCALRCLASHSGTFPACALHTAALFFASSAIIYAVIWSRACWRAIQLSQPIVINESIMVISLCQSSINYESIRSMVIIRCEWSIISQSSITHRESYSVYHE